MVFLVSPAAAGVSLAARRSGRWRRDAAKLHFTAGTDAAQHTLYSIPPWVISAVAKHIDVKCPGIY